MVGLGATQAGGPGVVGLQSLGQRLDLVKVHPWVRGMRVSLSVTNLFNQRQRVTDQTGEVPIGFQPAYLDPLGRTVRLSVRKLFF